MVVIIDFFFQAADGIRAGHVTGVQTCALPIFFHLTNGRLKYEDVPRPVEEINAIVTASQDRIEIEESGFVAADNRLRLQGFILNPLDENSRTVDISSDLFFDLASISQFYPIDEDTLTLRGELTAQIVLRGAPDPDQLETLLQESQAQLTNGYIFHAELPSPIEDLSFLRPLASARKERSSMGEGTSSSSMQSCPLPSKISPSLPKRAGAG